MFPFTCDHLHSITYRNLMCFFWERYFLPLIIWLKNMILILKSLYKDLRRLLIFIEPKFSNIFIKILKRFLKVFCLFISVKKINIFTISLKYFTKILKNIFYFWRRFKISEDLWTYSEYFQPWQKYTKLKYNKMLLHWMFHLYFSGW